MERYHCLIKRFFFVLLVFGLTMCSAVIVRASEEIDSVPVEDEAEKRVLFVGNSFTEGVNGNVGEMLKDIAHAQGKNMEVKIIAHDSARLSYYSSLQKQYMVYHRELIEALLEHEWDYIVLQENSKGTIETFRTSTYAALNELKTTISCYQPDAKVLLYMTHGYDNGTTMNVDGKRIHLTASGMQQMVQARYVYLADKMKWDLVPVGMYFSREGFCFPEEKILGWDSKHPNTTGYFLAACAFYKSIFEELPQNIVPAYAEQDLVSEEKQLKMYTVIDGDLQLNANVKVLKPGQSAALYAVSPAGGTISYKSLDRSVAVFADGKITAKKEGTTAIVAKDSKGFQSVCWVTVERDCLFKNGLMFGKSDYYLASGDKMTLLPEISDRLSNVVLKWSSGSKSVASVTGSGMVTAHKPGKAVISVEDETSGKKASYSLYIKLPAVKQISSSVAGFSSEKLGCAKILWKSVAGAKDYSIYRASSKKGTYKKIATTPKTHYTDKNVKFNQSFYYRVKANHKYEKCNSSFSSSVKVVIPRQPSVKVKSHRGKRIRLSWDKNTAATGYLIYRAEGKKKKYKRIATITGNTQRTYNDKKIKKGKVYYYKIKAVRKIGDTVYYSKYSKVLKVKAE